MCFVTTEQELGTVRAGNANYAIWLLFNLPILCVWTCSTVVAINSYFRLRRGLRETFKARERAMRRARDFIICYTVYWLVVAVLYFAAQVRAQVVLVIEVPMCLRVCSPALLHWLPRHVCLG